MQHFGDRKAACGSYGLGFAAFAQKLPDFADCLVVI
jgi:hypothetical protein